MKRNHLIYIFIVLLLLNSCQPIDMNKTETQNWQQQLESQIKLLGHRNWIVVADAAYPLQSNPGITTILSDKSQMQTLKFVNDLIAAQTHIKPNIYLDKEIDFVAEEDAQGIESYRNELSELFGDQSTKLIHEDIISKLDEASELFNVVIIKTDFTIPYTTVFFQLDCKYWDAEAEAKLRNKIGK